jgi:hypothetical protein
MIFCYESVLVLAMIWIPHLAMVTWLFSVLLVLNQGSTFLQIGLIILSKLQFSQLDFVLITLADGCIAETLLLMETSHWST